jgi:hypothetical protein
MSARSVLFNFFKFKWNLVEPLNNIKHLVSHSTKDVDFPTYIMIDEVDAIVQNCSNLLNSNLKFYGLCDLKN